VRRQRRTAAVTASSPAPPQVRTIFELLGDISALQQLTSDSIADCERRVKEANDELHALYLTREGLSHALGRNNPGGVGVANLIR